MLNIISFLKSASESTLPNNDGISYCVTILEGVINEATPTKKRKLEFIKEQLILATKTKKNRRYSAIILAMAVMWDNISPALYRHIVAEDFLTLPVEKHVRRLSGPTMSTGLPDATIEYLRKRIDGLNQRERLQLLMADEVYSAKRVEYQNGKFYGLENFEVTTTLLCFMIKSVAGKYEDVVAMVPLSSISAEIIQKWWMKVLEEVTKIGFEVVASSVDAHSSNRKFYVLLSNGKEGNTWIEHPYLPVKKIFFLFDSVHVFKNMYNQVDVSHECDKPKASLT